MKNRLRRWILKASPNTRIWYQVGIIKKVKRNQCLSSNRFFLSSNLSHNVDNGDGGSLAAAAAAWQRRQRWRQRGGSGGGDGLVVTRRRRRQRGSSSMAAWWWRRRHSSGDGGSSAVRQQHGSMTVATWEWGVIRYLWLKFKICICGICCTWYFPRKYLTLIQRSFSTSILLKLLYVCLRIRVTYKKR